MTPAIIQPFAGLVTPTAVQDAQKLIGGFMPQRIARRLETGPRERPTEAGRATWRGDVVAPDDSSGGGVCHD